MTEPIRLPDLSTARACLIALAGALFLADTAFAQSFVEYPGHPATYGDHAVANVTWIGGPTTLSVTFETDGTLHDDGMGASQRTARNTLNFLAPRDPTNPQNYDDPLLTTAYGSRLPLLQQLSASGTTVLTYWFDAPVSQGFDLFVADLDQSDSVVVAAFGPGNVPLDMTGWSLAAEGDLSDFKDTGTVFSAVVAPTPTTGFSVAGISLNAVDDTNYNRSYSILRPPSGVSVERVEITFSGSRNSPSRAFGGNASHVYLALSTVPEPEFGMLLMTGSLALLATRRRHATQSDRACYSGLNGDASA